MGMPSSLIQRTFEVFARRPQRSNSWSVVLGEAPDRRIDALELFTGLALTCRGTLKNKLSTLFLLYDIGETGVLVEDDLGALISSCASFLHRLGLTLPISIDEAAFVAGEAVAMSCGSTTTTVSTDEIDRLMFVTWAQRAKLPARVLELLALPHRFSRIVDLVYVKVRLLLQRLSTWNGARNFPEVTARPCGERSIDSYRASTQLPQRILSKKRSNNTLFALPPVLSGIGPHDAVVMLETSPGGAPAAECSTSHVVVTVEERKGSRFFSVDSQTLILQGGKPTALRFCGLRASTDHRVQLSCHDFRAQVEAARQDVRGISHKCSTLRFMTLPADANIVTEARAAVHRQVSERRDLASKTTPRVMVVGSYNQTRGRDSCHALPSLLRSSNGERGNSDIEDRGISVLVKHRGVISLEAVDKHDDVEPWWATAGPPMEMTGAQSFLSWPLCNEFPLPTAIDPAVSNRQTPSSAPFCGEGIETALSEGFPSQPWDTRKAGVGEIDIVVHVSPDWQAAEVIRRCFRVLEECRLECPAVEEDARDIVSRKVLAAVRSLVRKNCWVEGRTLRDKGARSCAHVVLGSVHPWLGLNQVWRCCARSPCLLTVAVAAADAIAQCVAVDHNLSVRAWRFLCGISFLCGIFCVRSPKFACFRYKVYRSAGLTHDVIMTSYPCAYTNITFVVRQNRVDLYLIVHIWLFFSRVANWLKLYWDSSIYFL